MILDHTNGDSIRRCTDSVKASLAALRLNLRLNLQPEPRLTSDLDVRLVSNSDGELWFATGDVQYDATHGAACGAITLCASDSDDTLDTKAYELVSGVADQLAQLASEEE